jgi:hypothetical protein
MKPNKFGVARAAAASTALVCAALATPAIAWGSCSSVAACVLGDNTGSGFGVEGDSTSTYGIIGSTTFAATSVSHGVAGVMGTDKTRNVKNPYNVGVLGSSYVGIGVSGNSMSNAGMQGNSISFDGVVGRTHYNATGAAGRAGVVGSDLSSNGTDANAGVLGISPNGTAVAGQSDAGYGVSGTSSDNVGILGQSTSGTGVYGQSLENGPGVYGVSGSSYGVGAISFNGEAALLAIDNNTNGVAMLAEAPTGAQVLDGYNPDSGDVVSIDASGNMILAGTLTQKGSPLVRTAGSHGEQVATFGERSSSATVEDMGEARLVAGHAFVPLDRTFAAVIDKAVKYLVFLTPEGDNRGLYASGYSAAGFSVTESGGGHSTLAFDYRVVAKPYDAGSARLPAMSGYPQLRRTRTLPHLALPKLLPNRR